MSKRIALVMALALVAGALVDDASSYQVSYGFDSSWTGDYAPGWENTPYRHGDPPVSQMMQYTTESYAGAGASELRATSVPDYGASWMFWAAASPTGLNDVALQKQYDPYISVWYKEEGFDTSADLHTAFQVAAVPSWTNLYLNGNTEDWTDVQLGNHQSNDPANYYYIAAGENSPSGWQDTGIARKTGEWVNFKMQLNSSTGNIDFYIDGVNVGSSYRNDYVDLTNPYFMVRFTTPLSDWETAGIVPSVIIDEVTIGSSFVPAPAAVFAGMGLLSLLGLRRRR